MKNKIICFAICFATVFFLSPVSAHNSQDSFFKLMKSHCGKIYFGRTVFPTNKEDPFVGKTLKMTVKNCSESEIKIPFQVGDDTSRTWILTKKVKGLLFKHDHRLPDGSADPVTLYGGFANQSGTNLIQFFPADEDTQILIPAATTNVWSLEFDKDNNQFIYYLQRNNKPRYKAIFDLEYK